MTAAGKAKPKSRFIGDITACNAKSVGLLSQYYQYGSADRNGLRHCRVACNVVAIASLKVRPIAVASCNDYTASCNDKGTGRRPNAIPVFFGRLVPPGRLLCRTNVLLMDMLFIYNRNMKYCMKGS